MSDQTTDGPQEEEVVEAPAPEEAVEAVEEEQPEAKVDIAFRNRIKELRSVPAKELLSNPKNWRIHSDAQQEALRNIIDRVGFVDALMARETEDGELILIDGHLRKDLLPDEEVPVLIVDLTEEEADYVLALHDGVTSMADVDEEKLQELLMGVCGYEEDQITAALVYSDNFPDFQVYEEIVNEEMKKEMEAEQAVDGVDFNPEDLQDRVMSEDDLKEEEDKLTHIWEALWDSDLPYGIPPLDIERCPPIPQHGVATFMGYNADTDYMKNEDQWWLLLYGREPKSKQNLLPLDRTILGFYVDDWRFEGMWTNPVPSLARLKNFGLQYAISPNFSLGEHFPMAVNLFNIYRARWVGRAMQEAGIQVIPDAIWSTEDSFEYCFLGIPKGCPCVAVQLQTCKNEHDMPMRVKGLDHLMETVEPQSLLIYGGECDEVENIRKRNDIPITYIESRWDRLSQHEPDQVEEQNG